MTNNDPIRQHLEEARQCLETFLKNEQNLECIRDAANLMLDAIRSGERFFPVETVVVCVTPCTSPKKNCPADFGRTVAHYQLSRFRTRPTLRVWQMILAMMKCSPGMSAPSAVRGCAVGHQHEWQLCQCSEKPLRPRDSME